MEFSKELIEKAKACRTAEELLALAKENEIELTKEDAEALFEELREGELADEELNNVAGGVEGCKRHAYEKEYFNSKEEVQFIFNIGEIRQEYVAGIGHHTKTVKIVDRRTKTETDRTWWDEYKTEKISGFGSCDWVERSQFEKE